MAEEKQTNSAVNDLQDVEEIDDFFEKILNEDIEIPKDDEVNPGAKTSDNKKIETKSDEDQNNKEEESIDSLKAKIAELEKERKGRLSDVVKSRQEKAQFKSELQELKSAVATLLSKRSDALKGELEEEEKKTPLSETKKVIEFGEDDKAFVDLSEVKEAIASETAKTRAELDEMKREKAIAKANEAYINNVKSVISEDADVFNPAYDNLKDIFKDFNDKIIEMQDRTGEMGTDGTLSQDVALELFSGSPEEKEFMKEYPGIDPTRIARAFNSKVDLRVGLKHIAEIKGITKENKSEADTLDEKIKAAQKKPSGLAHQENRSATNTGDLIERISQLSPLDFENLSDAETAKIEAMLRNEELKG